MTYSLLAKAEQITGWTHGELASIVGVSRPLVQAVISGRTPEYLTAPQIAALLAAVRLYRDRVIQGAAELEAFN